MFPVSIEHRHSFGYVLAVERLLRKSNTCVAFQLAMCTNRMRKAFLQTPQIDWLPIDQARKPKNSTQMPRIQGATL